MKLDLFGPSREEVDQIAHDLIVVHGLAAHDEAVRLAEVAHLLPHGLRQSKLYRLAAAEIERSFAIARETVLQRRTGDSGVLALVARLNAQGFMRKPGSARAMD